jgi:hypothetical protein
MQDTLVPMVTAVAGVRVPGYFTITSSGSAAVAFEAQAASQV